MSWTNKYIEAEFEDEKEQKIEGGSCAEYGIQALVIIKTQKGAREKKSFEI